ncbi:hypothetical protein [Spongiactinospora gelatinilytica]|uniref:hypothetical protein n=1 Tax=Spongiactinospora gelatinilytica TaxID=2666298 RepID=UPI0011B93966|nr:hypothetical protein [Spongiactinospora gelatinilytica]
MDNFDHLRGRVSMSLLKKIGLGVLAVVVLMVVVPGAWKIVLVAPAAVVFGVYCWFLWVEDSRSKRN